MVNNGFLFSLRITSSSNLFEPNQFLLRFKKFPAQLKVLSLLAEEHGMESTVLATFDRSGKVSSCFFHHSRTLTLLSARLKESNLKNSFSKGQLAWVLTEVVGADMLAWNLLILEVGDKLTSASAIVCVAVAGVTFLVDWNKSFTSHNQKDPT